MGRPEFTKDKRILGIRKSLFRPKLNDTLALVSSAFVVLGCHLFVAHWLRMSHFVGCAIYMAVVSQ
jgi:uncharacterized membrane protein SirB2